MLKTPSIDSEIHDPPLRHDSFELTTHVNTENQEFGPDSSCACPDGETSKPTLETKHPTVTEADDPHDLPISICNTPEPDKADNETAEGFCELQRAVSRELLRKSEREQVLNSYEGRLKDKHETIRGMIRFYHAENTMRSSRLDTIDAEIERNTFQRLPDDQDAYNDLDKLQKELQFLDDYSPEVLAHNTTKLERITLTSVTVAVKNEELARNCLEAAQKCHDTVYNELIRVRGGIKTIARPRNGELSKRIIFNTDGSDEHTVCFPQENRSRKKFYFDRVLAPECSNAQLWSEEIQPLIESVLSTLDSSVTILVTGRTGSGKSYTMCEGENAIVPSTITCVFEKKARLNANGKSLEISVSAVEVYCGLAFDLRSDPKEEVQFKIGPKSNIYLPHKDGTIVKDVPTKSAVHCREAFDKTDRRRQRRDMTVFDTSVRQLRAPSGQRNPQGKYVNTRSSRGHLVYTLHLKVGERNACIQLVDLAGTEDLISAKPKIMNNQQIALMDARGTAKEEGVAINQSLNELHSFLFNWTVYRHRTSKGPGMIARVLQRGINGNTPLIAYIATMHTQDVQSSSRTCQSAAQLLIKECRQ